MFGLMKFRQCESKTLPQQHKRLHYCGVCKAMGRMYGQSTRVFLNYDAIFLAELLTFLGEGHTNYHQEWSPSLLSYNCFRLPSEEDIPLALQYAASVNVLFSGVKIRDNAADNNSFLWRQAGKLYDGKFTRAEQQLEDWGLDLEAVNGLLKAHEIRELEHPKLEGLAYLQHLADATAQVTGQIFGQGAEVLGKPALKGRMQTLGEDFGKLIYLLDAYTDYEKDFRKGHFNPIRNAWKLESPTMPEEIRMTVAKYLLQTAGMLESVIANLPLRGVEKSWFQKRVKDNLLEQLGMEEEMICGASTCTTSKPQRKRISLRRRWQFIDNLQQIWAKARIRKRSSFAWTWLAFSMVAVLALFFPALLHAKADWFSSVDPDFLHRFGDLHPDWESAPEILQGNSCNNCNCCDGCNDCCGNCNNCCNGCNNGCDNCECNNCQCDCDCSRSCKCKKDECAGIIVGFILLAVFVYAAIAVLAFFVIRWLLRLIFPETFKPAPKVQQTTQATAPIKKPFRNTVEYPGISRTVLLSSAQDWFAAQYPAVQADLDISHPEFSTLTSIAQIPIRASSNTDGPSLNYGKVTYKVSLRIEDGAVHLHYHGFEHLGSSLMPHGGPLKSPHPMNSEGNMTQAAWDRIKNTVALKIIPKVEAFPQTFTPT